MPSRRILPRARYVRSRHSAATDGAVCKLQSLFSCPFAVPSVARSSKTCRPPAGSINTENRICNLKNSISRWISPAFFGRFNLLFFQNYCFCGPLEYIPISAPMASERTSDALVGEKYNFIAAFKWVRPPRASLLGCQMPNPHRKEIKSRRGEAN